ncbi:MAG: AAA family ATPase [Candidatus Hydrogenedentota bacterium]
MKIERLDLRAFGVFEDHTLEFGEGGLQLVYGPNEAGKSTALRALRALFYGIHPRTAYGFQHGYGALRIGAALRNRNGDSLEVIRRKGRKKNLRDAQDRAAVDEARLQQMIGGADEDTFTRLFGLDHDALAAGGRAMVTEGGAVGEKLLAGAGYRNPKEVLAELDKACNALYRARASNPRINQALAQLKDARKRLRGAQLAPLTWRRACEELEDLTAKHADAYAQWQRLDAEHARLSRIHNALPRVSRWEDLRRQLAGLCDAPRLAGDFTMRRRDAQQARDQAQRDHARHAKQAHALRERIDALEVDQAVLDQGPLIDALAETMAVLRAQRKTRDEELAPEYRQMVATAERARAQLPPGIGGEDIAVLRPALNARRLVQDLAPQCETVLAAIRQARDHRDECQQRLRTLEAEIGKGAPPDPTPLQQAARDARSAGDLDARCAQLRSDLEARRSAADDALASLGFWQGTLDALARLPVPDAAVVEDFEKQFQERENERKAFTDAREAAWQEYQAAQAEAEAVAAGQAVPTQADLDAVRARRDAAWRAAQEAWGAERAPGDTKEDAEALWQEYANPGPPPADLVEAVSESIQQADVAADRLRNEADRVARLAHAHYRQQAAEAEMAHFGKLLADTAPGEKLAKAWRGVWEPAGIEPQAPALMRAWLERRNALLQQYEGLRMAGGQLHDAETARDKHRAALEKALADAGEPLGPETPLIHAVEQAEIAAEALRARRQEAQSHAEEAKRLRAEALPRAEKQLENAMEDEAHWARAWAAAVGLLGLDDDAPPALALETVDTIESLFEAHDQARRLEDRITAIDAQEAEFEKEVGALVAQAAPDLAGHAADPAIQTLRARLRQQQDNAHQRETLAQQCEEHEQASAEAKTRGEETNGLLAALCAEAGADAEEALPEAEERAACRRTCEEKMAEVEEELRQDAQGAAVDDFVAEARAEAVENLAARIQTLTQECETAAQHERALDNQKVRAQADLDRHDGSAEAAEANEEIQRLLAQIAADAARYGRLHIARESLRRAIEIYREQHQAPLITRASELFTRLTRGRYTEVRTDFDDNGDPVLHAIRQGEAAPLGLDALSDGAADQLYLALRIASVEEYAAVHEPIPFVLDDVFINFDNDRAAAGLQILAELAGETQILFFTHHQHLVALAQENLPAAALHVHTLPPMSGRAAGHARDAVE